MRYAPIAATAAAALVAYLNSLQGDFVFDDSRAIVTNPDLRPDAPIRGLFFNDFWGTPLNDSGSHKSYRPLCVLSFRLNYIVGGLDPYGYHAVNVALHSAVTAAYTALIDRLIYDGQGVAWPALVAGMLFAVHPIHTEAVAGVVGRADLLAALFFLLSLGCYAAYTEVLELPAAGVRSHRPPALFRTLCLLGCVICAALAMLSKETGLTALPVCAAWQFAKSGFASLSELRKTVLQKFCWPGQGVGLAVIAVSSILLVFLRAWLMEFSVPDFAAADNPAASTEIWTTRALTFWYLPAANAALLFWPATLSFDWSMDAVPLVESLLDIRVAAALTFYAGILLLLLPASFWHAHPSGEGSDGHPAACAALLRHHDKKHHDKNILRAEALGRQAFNDTKPGCGYPLAQLKHTHAYLTCRESFGSIAVDTDQRYRRRPSTSSAESHQGEEETGCSGSSSSSSSSSSSDLLRMQRHGCETSHRGRRRGVLLGLALLVLPFVPASNLFFYVGFVIAERVLYIPSMGYCLLVVEGVRALVGQLTHCSVLYRSRWRQQRGARVMAVAVALMLVGNAVRTVSRNSDWATEERLYRSGIRVNPAKAWANLANALKGRGDLRGAEEAYALALQHRGNMADVHYNYGILLQDQKRHSEAVVAFWKALSYRPRLTPAYLNLGVVKAAMGATAEAEQIYRQCAEVDASGLKDPRLHESTKISCLYNLGRLHAEKGHYANAIDIFLEAVARRPQYYPPQSLYNLLGEAYFNSGDLVRAEHWYTESLKAKPDHAPAHVTMARLLAKKARNEEASSWFLTAMELRPNDVTTLQQYASFLMDVGREKESERYWYRAAALAPDNFDVLMNTGNALRRLGRDDAAEKSFQQMVLKFPQIASGHASLGAMLHLNGKYEEAENSYIEALRLNSKDTLTQGNLKKLRKLLLATATSEQGSL